VGQVYNTLERLERDGLVARSAVSDEQGLSFWEITEAGRTEARDWLGTPVRRGAATRDELAVKLTIAATLPDADAGAVIRGQRVETAQHLEMLRGEQRRRGDEGAEDLAHWLALDSLICAAEAELLWLDRTEQRLAGRAPHSAVLGLSTDRPRRGRPARAATAP
jgi:DNA-binding PadR family transcriptional regulator